MNIKTIPDDDKILRQRSDKVIDISVVKGVALKLKNYLNGHKNAVGVSAIQVGVPVRVMVIKLLPRSGFRAITQVFINPIVKIMGKETLSTEGCLSIPKTVGQIKRNDMVHVKYFDENKREHNEFFIGRDAISIQHEIDHFEGILFIDKAEKTWEVK